MLAQERGAPLVPRDLLSSLHLPSQGCPSPPGPSSPLALLKPLTSAGVPGAPQVLARPHSEC